VAVRRRRAAIQAVGPRTANVTTAIPTTGLDVAQQLEPAGHEHDGERGGSIPASVRSIARAWQIRPSFTTVSP
jgi:hypothetical protein